MPEDCSWKGIYVPIQLISFDESENQRMRALEKLWDSQKDKPKKPIPPEFIEKLLELTKDYWSKEKNNLF